MFIGAFIALASSGVLLLNENLFVFGMMFGIIACISWLVHLCILITDEWNS